MNMYYRGITLQQVTWFVFTLWYCSTSQHEQWVTNRTVMPATWWRHQMETFSALLAICVGNSPVTGEFHAQRPGTRSFDVFFDLHLNKRLSKQSWGWWFEMLSRPLWRHCNEWDHTTTAHSMHLWTKINTNCMMITWYMVKGNRGYKFQLYCLRYLFDLLLTCDM